MIDLYTGFFSWTSTASQIKPSIAFAWVLICCWLALFIKMDPPNL